ncbi:MAG TPA: Na/Pi cotransporter family protein [Bdellovibrionota bacterium]|nr:Na/Pi cotransporter family protein [Bdellovibrionota bacterium]
MTTFSFSTFLGGLCFFLYGLHLTEESLRQAAGDELRGWLTRLTRHRLSAFFFGALMTVVLQSSTATTVMLVGLTGIGVLSLRSAMPMVLGADVGTTLLVLILASFVQLDAAAIALSILIVGFLCTFFFRANPLRTYARALLGFGFLFYGLSLVAGAGGMLRGSILVREILMALSNHRSVALFFAALVTGLIQSSAALIGILLSFSASGILDVTQAVPFILGANLGNSVAPLLVGIRSQDEGKRLASFHVTAKVLGVLVAFPFMDQLVTRVQWITASPTFQIAAIHILFNIGIAVILLPTISTAARILSIVVPARPRETRFGAKYLDEQSLDSPSLAFANVFRETLRMAEIAQKMVAQSLIPFEEGGTETMERLEELDDQVDRLDREIKFYLARVNMAQLTDVQARRQVELLTLTHDLESIGDVINKDLMELAKKKRRKNVSFSKEGWAEIQEFHRKVMENFHLAITSLATGDAELGSKVIRHKSHLALLEQELGQNHLRRLHQGLREAIDTSSIHLDILSNLRRINSIVSKLSYPVLDRRDQGGK